MKKTSGEQYRFVLPGSKLHRAEWEACLEQAGVAAVKPKIRRRQRQHAARRAGRFLRRASRGTPSGSARKMVVDTSGAALAAALEEGVTLIKPNLDELGRIHRRDARHATPTASPPAAS